MTTPLADELPYLSVARLAGAVRARQLSAVEVARAVIEQVHRRNPALNAFVYLNEDDALRQARAVEDAVMAGGDPGPLAGVPTAIKDLADSRPGWKGTLGGIRALRDHVMDSYCSFAWRMERAGAVAIGKTNSPTMGFRGTCDNPLFGPTRNPFDLAKKSGGSSGGAAAAVAAGLVPFAEGTDGGGSIRIPAAWSGVYGFKGTSGRVARLQRPQAFPPSTLFTFEGCLTRSVEDTVLVLESLAGYDPRDPYCLAETVPWRQALNGSVRGWRVAYTPDFGVFPVDARVRALVDAAVGAFAAAGAHVEEVRLDLRHTALELGDLWCRLMVPSSVVQTERLRRQGIDLLGEHRGDLQPELVEWIERGQRFTVLDMARDQELRTEVYDAVQAAFADHDLLLGPTLVCPPVDNAADGNTLGSEGIDGEPVNRLIGFCPTFLFNFTGHPAASVPAGLVEGRWPVGLQIVGPRFGDAAVITASAVYEQARPWHDTYRLCATEA